VIPWTSLWWLDHYADLRAYLEHMGAVARTDACVIYRLSLRLAASGVRTVEN